MEHTREELLLDKISKHKCFKCEYDELCIADNICYNNKTNDIEAKQND